MSNSSNSSKIARSIASQMWGTPVQSQKKLAPGVYWFSTPGHGGLVGIVDEMDVSPEAIQAARETGLVHTTVRVQTGYKSTRTYSTALGYRESDLTAYEQAYPRYTERRDVWIGEEDVEWATLATVSPALREGMARNGFDVNDEETAETVQSYFPDYFKRLQDLNA